MKVIDIMKSAAHLLGLNNVLIDLDSLDPSADRVILSEESESLFNLCRVAIQEFCTNYTPVVNSALISTTDHEFPLGNLTNYLRLKRVTKDNQNIKIKIINKNIVVPEDGDYEVEYFTYPDVESVKDDLDFLTNFTPDVMTLGTCAYWSISHGQYADFNRFHDEYISKANAIKDLRVFSLPKRRWE